jgi:hypothetical protein
MKRICSPSLALLAAAAFGAAAQTPDFRQMQDDGRRVAAQFVQTLGGELRREMEASGPLRALLTCKYAAPELASSLSRQTGWRVTRVALRPRNPAVGQPDAWEQKVLLDFESRVSKGEKAEALEYADIVDEPQGRAFRYMKALAVGPLCLKCHGPASEMSDALRGELRKEYPFDQATGYALGQVRGAVSIKRPLRPSP